MRFAVLPQEFPGIKSWGSRDEHYTYVISKDSTQKYSAIAKSHHGGASIHLGGYAAHDTFEDAKLACLQFQQQKT